MDAKCIIVSVQDKVTATSTYRCIGASVYYRYYRILTGGSIHRYIGISLVQVRFINRCGTALTNKFYTPLSPGTSPIAGLRKVASSPSVFLRNVWTPGSGERVRTVDMVCKMGFFRVISDGTVEVVAVVAVVSLSNFSWRSIVLALKNSPVSTSLEHINIECNTNR